ncbi:hypothetical protein [Nonomuraea fuscirosea]|uniref:hypothetical protein n=1 Tax=Nonomuraea fuscirosea TaxID=1291556 RepID=UPI00342F5F9E
MDSQTVIAVSAIVIAIASLVVSVYQVRATRLHNRHTLRPLLQLRLKTSAGQRAGIWMVNTGLGPAIITGTRVWLDGEELGSWNRETSRQVRRDIAPYPRASALSDGMGVPPGFTDYLLTVDDYNPAANGTFLELITRRMDLEVSYESLYGGEGYTVSTRRNSWWQSEIPPAYDPAPAPSHNDVSGSDEAKLS